jgi:hypothetical protein
MRLFLLALCLCACSVEAVESSEAAETAARPKVERVLASNYERDVARACEKIGDARVACPTLTEWRVTSANSANEQEAFVTDAELAQAAADVVTGLGASVSCNSSFADEIRRESKGGTYPAAFVSEVEIAAALGGTILCFEATPKACASPWMAWLKTERPKGADPRVELLTLPRPASGCAAH